MKADLLLKWGLFFMFISSCKQYVRPNPIETLVGLNSWDSNCLYLVGKSSDSKYNFLKNYNIEDSSINHIGIGLFYKGLFEILDVNMIKFGRGNARVLSIDSFASVDKIKSLKVWKVKLKDKELDKAKYLLDSFKLNKNSIHFDNRFLLGNGDSVLYCSELCVMFLEKTTNYRIKFTPTIMSTRQNEIMSAYFDSDSLQYYPVDFFYEHKCLFEIVFSGTFKKTKSTLIYENK